MFYKGIQDINQSCQYLYFFLSLSFVVCELYFLFSIKKNSLGLMLCFFSSVYTIFQNPQTLKL